MAIPFGLYRCVYYYNGFERGCQVSGGNSWELFGGVYWRLFGDGEEGIRLRIKLRIVSWNICFFREAVAMISGRREVVRVHFEAMSGANPYLRLTTQNDFAVR